MSNHNRKPPKITVRPLKVLVAVELVTEHDGKISGTYNNSKTPVVIMESDIPTADIGEIVAKAIAALKKEIT